MKISHFPFCNFLISGSTVNRPVRAVYSAGLSQSFGLSVDKKNILNYNINLSDGGYKNNENNKNDNNIHYNDNDNDNVNDNNNDNTDEKPKSSTDLKDFLAKMGGNLGSRSSTQHGLSRLSQGTDVHPSKFKNKNSEESFPKKNDFFGILSMGISAKAVPSIRTELQKDMKNQNQDQNQNHKISNKIQNSQFESVMNKNQTSSQREIELENNKKKLLMSSFQSYPDENKRENRIEKRKDIIEVHR